MRAVLFRYMGEKATAVLAGFRGFLLSNWLVWLLIALLLLAHFVRLHMAPAVPPT